jgi:hypothetical protein
LYDTGESGRMNGPPPDDQPPDGPPDPDVSDPGSTPDADRFRSDDDGGASIDRVGASPGGTATGDAVDDPLGDLLPRPGVDSRWWYWIAAIPLYVVVGAALGLLFAVVALAGFGLGLDGGLIGFGLLFVLVVALGVAGLVLTILFPVATYVDARAIATSDASWTPDPLVWGLAALATVVLSAFTLSFVLAIYYLYKRHVAVGTP